MQHHATFCADRSNRCGAELWPFSMFKMATVRHLGFLKVGNFNRPYPSESESTSSRQFVVQIGQGVAEIWPF